MASRSVVPSRDLGLEWGLLFARYLLDSEELHYGYFTPDIPVKLANLPQAQKQHTDLILSHLPQSAQTVLDVGCGTGGLALRMAQRGCQVDCVAPDSTLLDCAQARLGDRARIFRERFEHFQGDRKYDAVVFSESFQYVPVDLALANIDRLLKPGGCLLICDFFKRQGKQGSPIGGGHKIHTFLEAAKQAGFEASTDLDITAQTAPTMTLVAEFLDKVGAPFWRMGVDYCTVAWPKSTRLVKWWFKQRLAKLDEKYFSGRRNAATFTEFKTYRLMLFERTADRKPAEAGTTKTAEPATA
ncbi:MAG: methyltransferase domain-containing protein [Planctomycetes bacterium]|nr:methyltransferase domain-containing protein [Planctomycetota bacterium]